MVNISQEICVAFECSEEFSPVLSVALFSLLSHVPSNRKIRIWILSRSMTECTFEKICTEATRFFKRRT
jgi:hypothetical protein